MRGVGGWEGEQKAELEMKAETKKGRPSIKWVINNKRGELTSMKF